MLYSFRIFHFKVWSKSTFMCDSSIFVVSYPTAYSIVSNVMQEGGKSNKMTIVSSCQADWISANNDRLCFTFKFQHRISLYSYNITKSTVILSTSNEYCTDSETSWSPWTSSSGWHNFSIIMLKFYLQNILAFHSLVHLQRGNPSLWGGVWL